MLKDLDLEKIMIAQAKNLSGGQKRKLSVGIAILGDPKVPAPSDGRVLLLILVCNPVVTQMFVSDPAVGRAHGGHGPLLQTPGVVAAAEPPSRQGHGAQHALHGRGRHPGW